MLEEAQSELEEWVRGVVGHVPVVWDAPPEGDSDLTVGLRWTDFLPAQTSSMERGRRGPLRVLLRHEVTLRGGSRSERARILERLLLSTHVHPSYRLRMDAQPGSRDGGTGVDNASPSLAVDVEITLAAPLPSLSQVVHPLRLETAGLRPLEGRVLGPGDLPVVGAEVQMEELHRVAYTDSRGHFLFASVPEMAGEKLFRVRAKGKEFEAVADLSDEEYLLIRCDLTEE